MAVTTAVEGPVSSAVSGPVGDGGYVLDFNGTDEYATVPTWSLKSAKGRLSARLGNIADAGDFFPAALGTPQTDGNLVYIDDPSGNWTEFGRDGASYYDDTAWDVRAEDFTALQSRWVVEGNGTDIYATPGSAVNATGDWRVSFRCVYESSGACVVLGRTDSVNGSIQLNTSGGITYTDPSGNTVSSSNSLLTDGQHHAVELVKNGSTLEYIVDGTSDSTDALTDAGDPAWTAVHRANTVYSPTNFALADLDIQDPPLTAYGDLDGTSGDYFSTPNSTADSVIGSIDVWARVALDDYTTGSIQALIAKYATGTSLSILFDFNATGQLRLTLSADGSTLVAANTTSPIAVADTAVKAVRAYWDDAANEVTFYTSEKAEPQAPSDWTEVQVVSMVLAGILASDDAIEIGSVFSGAAFNTAGKFYRAQVYSGNAYDGGTLVADLNPAKSNLIKYSEALDTAPWGGLRCTLTDTGDTFMGSPVFESEVTTASPTPFARQTNSAATAGAGEVWTATVAAKAGSYGAFILLLDGGFPSNCLGTFDLEAGTVVVGSAADSATIESLGDGWYLCSVTGTSASAVTNSSPQIRWQDGGSWDVGDTFLVTRVTLNRGAVASEYLKTEATPALGDNGEWAINGDATVNSRHTLGEGGDTYKWAMGETPAELTASAVAKNTGSTGSAYDMAWQSVDPATDTAYLPSANRYYPLNDGEGTNLVDLEAGEDGTAVNGPTWVLSNG